MLIQPIPFPAGGGALLLGDDTDDGSRHTHTGDFWEGWIAQATEDGTLNFLYVRGDPDGPHTANYRLVIYEAAGPADTAGAKLGETVTASSLGQYEQKKLALLSPVPITNGNYYAIGIHKDAAMVTARRGGTGGLAFSDAYANGAVDPAPTGFNNGGAPAIWGSD